MGQAPVETWRDRAYMRDIGTYGAGNGTHGDSKRDTYPVLKPAEQCVCNKTEDGIECIAVADDGGNGQRLARDLHHEAVYVQLTRNGRKK